MKDTLRVINQMQADGVFGNYAIGGAVGATFYLEPVATLDIGVFVSLQGGGDSPLLSLTPIYDYLLARGYKAEKEYIVIGSWPVQFLPPGNPLVEEALAQAVETEVESVRARVLTAEHLVAIALQTGRAKDFARILQFIESGVLDTENWMASSRATDWLPNGSSSAISSKTTYERPNATNPGKQAGNAPATRGVALCRQDQVVGTIA